MLPRRTPERSLDLPLGPERSGNAIYRGELYAIYLLLPPINARVSGAVSPWR